MTYPKTPRVFLVSTTTCLAAGQLADAGLVKHHRPNEYHRTTSFDSLKGAERI
jgi:hypothetical protein